MANEFFVFAALSFFEPQRHKGSKEHKAFLTVALHVAKSFFTIRVKRHKGWLKPSRGGTKMVAGKNQF